MSDNRIDCAKIENLEDGEVLFFLNPSSFRFVPQRGVDYSPKIKTLIRIMDTPAEDIYHHYIEQIIPPLIFDNRLINKAVYWD